MLVAYLSNSKNNDFDDIYLSVCQPKDSILVIRYEKRYIQNKDFKSYINKDVLLTYINDKTDNWIQLTYTINRRIPVREALIVEIVVDDNIWVVSFILRLKNNLKKKYVFLEKESLIKDHFYFGNENVVEGEKEISWYDTVFSLQETSLELSKIPFILTSKTSFQPYEKTIAISLINNQKCDWVIDIFKNWIQQRINKNINVHTIFVENNEDEKITIRIHKDNEKFIEIVSN